jgi:hypothetical protein
MKNLMIAFLIIAFYAAYLFFTKILFGDENLIIIKGRLPKFKLIETKTSRTQTSELAYLIFKLDKDDRLYTSKVDITGTEKGDDIFIGVVHSLKHAGEIEVSIKKAEIAAAKPKVYQIKADGKEIFGIIKKPGNNSNLFLVMLLFTLLFCSAYYWLQCLQVPIKKAHRMNVIR